MVNVYSRARTQCLGGSKDAASANSSCSEEYYPVYLLEGGERRGRKRERGRERGGEGQGEGRGGAGRGEGEGQGEGRGGAGRGEGEGQGDGRGGEGQGEGRGGEGRERGGGGAGRGKGRGGRGEGRGRERGEVEEGHQSIILLPSHSMYCMRKVQAHQKEGIGRDESFLHHLPQSPQLLCVHFLIEGDVSEQHNTAYNDVPAGTESSWVMCCYCVRNSLN